MFGTRYDCKVRGLIISWTNDYVRVYVCTCIHLSACVCLYVHSSVFNRYANLTVFKKKKKMFDILIIVNISISIYNISCGIVQNIIMIYSYVKHFNNKSQIYLHLLFYFWFIVVYMRMLTLNLKVSTL